MTIRRREFVYGSALGLIGAALAAPAAQVGAAGERASAFDKRESAVLEALGEVLLPGAKDAGVSFYVGSQLLLPIDRQVLMIKYLLEPPYLSFYKSALAALDAHSLAITRRPFARLSPAQATAQISQLSAGQLPDWSGPPQQLFHFVARNDALDVVYGTRQGFARLGVPYMAHIEPRSDWPA